MVNKACHVCLVFAVDWAMWLRDWICVAGHAVST